MKKSELRQIIREEIQSFREETLEEGLLDRVFDHFQNSANAAANKREVAKINKKVADGLEKLSSVEDEVKRMMNDELSDDELKALIKKLKA